ncbi:HD domain-containing protein [bacterium]|nr:MAG: HD domain-containing protein [bacterium]
MVHFPSLFNSEIQHIFKTIAIAAQEVNQDAYIIGGFVRDFYLSDKPGKERTDIDFVTLGSGIKLAEKVAELLKAKQLSVFKRFGTAHIHFKGYDLEFVGARKESYSPDSRKPVVENGTLQDDQNRRDFTINALSWSLKNYPEGKLHDPFGGLADIEKRIIRTPLNPEETFSDDPLRMMRAIRFATTLNFDIDPQTFQGIQKMAKRLEIISKERIIEELNKIISSNQPSLGFALLLSSELLHQFLPEMVDLLGAEEMDGVGHKDNFWHTLKVLDNVSKVSEDLWLRWAAILHDIAKPATKRFDKRVGWTFHGHEALGAKWVPRIFRRLSLPLDERMKYVQKLVRLHLRPISLVDDIVTDSAIRRLLFDAGDDIDDLMKLCRADITSKNPKKVQRYLDNFDKVEEKLIEVEEKDKIRNWQPPIKGEDIMKAFNLTPGKEVGLIKKAIEEAILNGDIPNEYDAAYQFMLTFKDKLA